MRTLISFVTVLVLGIGLVSCSNVDTESGGGQADNATNNDSGGYATNNSDYGTNDGVDTGDYGTNNGDYGTNDGVDTGDNGDNGDNGSQDSGTGVNIGGAQDFGVFRSKIEAGSIPSPDLLDPNGFFSEHYIKLPPADCGHSVCLYSMLARGRSILASDFMTVLAFAMVSPIKPSELDRPPTDFVFVLDRSGSMYLENKLEYMKQGLIKMLDVLDDEDRVAIVTYDDQIEVLSPFVSIASSRDDLKSKINEIYPRGSTNIYDALARGFELVEGREEANLTRPARVIILSDGQPTAGVLDTNTIVSFAARHVGPLVNLTSIGVGSDINYELMKNLAMEGGNFYFVEDAQALLDVFVEEANYFPVPIAVDARLDLVKGEGFKLGDPVGFPNWQGDEDGGHAEFANLYLASRTSEETEGGDHARRGGGSIMFMKLIPYSDEPTLVGLNAVLRYTDPQDSTDVELHYEYERCFGTEMLPVENEYYSDPMAIKSFAILNAYLVFKSVVTKMYENPYDYSCDSIRLLNHAMAYLKMMSDKLVDAGAATEDGDDDLYADGKLMARLAANIYATYYCYNVSPMSWDDVLAGRDPSEFERGGKDDPYYGGEEPNPGDPCCGDYGDEDDGYVEMSGGCSVGAGTSPSLPMILLAMAALMVARLRRTSRNYK